MKPLTESQWEAVSTTDRHLLVTAGAGTGKTYTVVAKVLYLLGVEVRGQRHAEPLRLADIAAITYTNQAAADLKEKLRAALRDEGRRQEAYEVDVARIGTIHSFCAEVLNDFALRTGRAPARRILDEGEAGAWIGEVVRETLLEELEAGANDGLKDLLALWSARDLQHWVAELLAKSDLLGRFRSSAAPGSPEATLIDLAERALARLHDRLDRESAIDFDRMILWARDLIRDDASVRRALQRRIRVLIIDEFQDVDPIQKEIAYLLADPESRRPDTPRLMLVGDPKQSIYRFRRADVTVWRAVERDFRERGLGKVVALAESFRSAAPVLGFADATVGRILDRPIDDRTHRDFEVPYLPVRATRQDGPPDRAVELLVVPPREDGARRKADEIRAAEAEAVARRALELHAEGTAWRDMAILLASWSAVDLYGGALERAGIPAYVLRNEGFYERREVLDLVLALEAIRDPRDDRALLGFLRSPFVGLADETLLSIARQLPRPYWDHIEKANVHERALLDRAIELLERHIRLRDRAPIAELLSSLLEESGYLAHLALLEGDGHQAIANVRQFLRQAAAHAETSVGDFLRMIRETRARGDRVGIARLHGEHDDVVTITSIHSAKGLEWRVVFWCDLVRASIHDDGNGLLVGRDRILLADPDAPRDEQSEAWRALLAEIQDEVRAERKRLWYVAATRAKDRLILSGIPLGTGGRASDESPARELTALFPELSDAMTALSYTGHDGRTFEALVRVAAPAPEASPPEQELRILPADVLPPPPAPIPAQAGRGRHSATAFLTFERCPRKHWFKYVVGLREPPVERSGPAFESALVRGQVVHDVLELLAEEAELDRLLEDAITHRAPDAPPPDEPDGDAYRQRLREEITAISAHPDYRAVADLPGARRELPFLYIHADGVYAEGKIDLAAPGPDGVILLDVKTGNPGAGGGTEKAELYAPQRNLYVTAVEAISGTNVARFDFLFSRTGTRASTPIGPELRQQARDAFERTAAAIARGEPAMTRFPEECNYCGSRTAGLCAGVPPRTPPGLESVVPAADGE